MPRYRYQTVDAHGRPISGELQAAGIEEAVEELQAKGLHLTRQEIEEIADAPIEPNRGVRPLSTAEAAQFAGNLAELTEARLPLGPGLRAMADELRGDWYSRLMGYLALGVAGVVVEDVRGRRLSSLFSKLSRQTDEGVPLETAVNDLGDRFPAHVRGLILAGTRTGRLAEVLGEFAALQRERSDLSWRIGMSMIYPLLMVLALVGMFILCGMLIVPEFVEIFESFETDMPAMTQLFIATSLQGTRVLLVLLAILLPLAFFWFVLPRPRWAVRCLYRVPFLGPVWRWQGLVEFSRLMGLLLNQDVPLPEALRLTGDGMQSPSLKVACLESAVQVEAGNTLLDCVRKQRAFPPSLTPFVDFGSQSSRLSDGFEAAAEAFQQRINVDARLWEIVIPPLMLVLVGGFIGFMVISLFLPLISLITTLS